MCSEVGLEVEKGGDQSVAMVLLCTSEFVAIGHKAEKPVANWLIVIGCICDATQDAEDINSKHVTARLLPRKHLPCYAFLLLFNTFVL